MKPTYSNYRVCYENGNPVTGKRIYELHKVCDCQECRHRAAWSKEPVNCATATTQDISKVDEVAGFLKNWNCKDGKKLLKTAYFKF